MDTTTETPPAAAPSIFADDQLTFAPDWHKTALPEEFHGLAGDAKSLKDVFARLKGSRDELAARGTGLRVPGEKATDEERTQFRADLLKHLGVPETADAYDLKPPEGTQVDEELIKEVSAIMPKAGVTKEGAKLISDTYNAVLQKRAEAIRAEQTRVRETERTELAAEYGDKVDTVVAQAKQVAKDAGWPEETMDPTNEAFVGAQPFRLIQGLLARIAKAEGVDRTGGNHTRVAAKDRAWAERVIAGKEPESTAYNNRHDPDNKRVYDEVMQAFAVAAGAKS